MISIALAVEDDLSEYVLREVLASRNVAYHIGPVFKKNGFGYLKKNCKAFNNMAKGYPVLLLTDLDRNPCPPRLIQTWLSVPLHPRFLFRIAEYEVEAWLLAHDKALRTFLGVRKFFSYPEPENLVDPKAELLKLAASSPKRELRENLTRRDMRGNLKQGPAYNSTLLEFIRQLPSFVSEANRCPSLKRLLRALDRLETIMNNQK